MLICAGKRCEGVPEVDSDRPSNQLLPTPNCTVMKRLLTVTVMTVLGRAKASD